MIKRILLVWFLANFALAGVFRLVTGYWYLQLPPVIGMIAELGLVILPNLVFPILLLRYGWANPVPDIPQALGWERRGWRPIGAGVVAFIVYMLLSAVLSNMLGPGIPYNKPGEGGGIEGLAGLLALALYIVFVAVTVLGEETMFRGLIQTQIGRSYGMRLGLLMAAVLFGLRHLPADIFYASAWHATPQMWLSRQADLYLGAVLLGLARYFGKSTYASAVMHALIFALIFFQGFV